MRFPEAAEKVKCQMKKICYVVTIPLTIRAFFIPQLRFLAENGYHVTVICSPDPILEKELGSSIIYLPVEIPRGISVGGSWKALKRLEYIFKREHFDLIQYSTPNAAFYASIAAKWAGCKVRNYHLMGLRYLGASGMGRAILKTIEKIACANSTSIECVSKSNMELGIREGLFPREKVTVVWNGSTGGVDLAKFDYARRDQWRNEIRGELGCSDKDFVYGFVGRITRDKGINELLEAYYGLNSDAKLLLVGRIEDEQTLNQELFEKAKKDSNVVIHNAVSDIERYYAAIDVLILPSYREGFGNVVIEAGAVGTPAIVSHIPGPIDTIDPGVTALTVPVRDAKALADAMERMRQVDYVNMGNSAARFAKEKFDSNVLCEKILERKQALLKT